MTFSMHAYFHDLAASLQAMVRGEEVCLTTFDGEDSDFCRFNGAKVRQAGRVQQMALGLRLIAGRRNANAALTLSGDQKTDQARLGAVVKTLREQLAQLPEDPYLLYATTVASSEHRQPNALEDSGAAVAKIAGAGAGRDLVGIYAAGGIYRGFANTLGQRNWYETFNFNFDFSIYLRADKAVKSGYAGLEWRDDDFARKVELAKRELAALEHAPRTIAPGRYRVYIAPQAMADVGEMLSWGGFSLKAHKTKQTPLLKMVDDGATMHPSVTITENTRDGIAPDFNSEGFTKPASVTLVEGGAYRNALVSPRSSVEYGVQSNGANEGEGPASMDVAAGGLDRDRILGELGTGILINNFHYLNFSDRPACRVTGMTRFASFWVEKGQIVAPLNVMRFDENIIKMLGEQLVGLTSEREMILSSGTYGQRATTSQRLPGALVEGFSLTL
jgi:predicted Zn-dependent protease